MIKIIYILWFQGFENAPEIVKKCLQSWIYYNPDWEIIKLDNTNLQNYLDLDEHNNIIKAGLSPNHLSDIIRLLLLQKTGGVWVDATTFCNLSLSNWLPNFIKEGFFAFERPSYEILISSWFFYSEKNHIITTKWIEQCNYFFKANDNSKEYDYLFLHHLFNALYANDKLVKNSWDKVPKFIANISNTGVGPMFLQTLDLFNNTSEGIISTINSKMIPLFKLTYKCDFENKYNDKTILYYLFSTIEENQVL
jgi:Leucine-rich repeat (LRR) protein